MDEYYDITYIEETTTYFCSEGHVMRGETYRTETKRLITELVCGGCGETREII